MFHEVFCQRFFVSCEQSSFFEVRVPSQAKEKVKFDPAHASRNVELLKALVDEQLDLNNLEHGVKGKMYSNHATKTEVSPWLEMTRWPRYFDGRDS
ncbi:hypothetical protein DM02DRAFT_678738 [Periconia macrospinosa]|uniref:Uncharacterized protein n=1 Tax=Periconia macrospinosa TaxID=97972 RepID=A0A2V1CWV8_9PLEO|nr:hypothetical protein DM02DRAFT_678738 [Periconia macrospinosa]